MLISRPTLLLCPLLCLLAACASPPRTAETVWATVVDVYSREELGKSHNARAAQSFKAAGFDERDSEQGRLLRVACGLATDHTWGSYAYLPAGASARKDEVIRLRLDDPGTDDRMGVSPVVGKAEGFKWPGRLQAHRYIPDWKERNLFLNFERIPLEPGQQGRYVISHGAYVIKCRQGNGD